ncbi:hypothetical protein [Polymorphospora lycopeni]|uniref:Dolichyl-phosphate-mannose-protein mannosyltransferase n=1 Tax=Polymorphospora lycopeni TaxID=3140240 RepID=A0ABV5CWM3_9ACTN
MTEVAAEPTRPARLRARVTDLLDLLSGLPATTLRLARDHWALLALLAIGGVLRLLVMVGYAPALWYQGDSQGYLGLAYREEPGVIRPYGYSFLLNLLLPFESVRLMVLVQHAAGLGLAAAAYALLQRRGVARWVALLATVPLVLDARTVALEHFLLAETLFTVLVTAGLVLLCWRDTPGWLACVVAGGLFGWAAVTRSVGLVALAVPLLYLILRRVPWLRVAAFASVVGVVLGGYLVWYHSFHGVYSFGTYGGRFLWSRTATFVECDRLTLTDRERQLCPSQPLGERLPSDLYLWNGGGPNSDFPDRSYDPVFSSFARKAILGQPLDFLAMVGTETWRTLRPGPPATERVACVGEVWEFPVTEEQTTCRAHIAPFDPRRQRFAGNATDHEHPLMAPLHTYSRVASVPATVVGLAFLLVVALALVRPRASTWREHLDPLTFAGLGLGMIVVSVSTSTLDPRYSIPSLPLAMIGAALAWQRFRSTRTAPPPSAPPAPAPSPEPRIVATGADH